MTFIEAIQHTINDDKRVRRKDWCEGDYLVLDLDRDIFIYDANDDKTLLWFANAEDIVANDWEII